MNPATLLASLRAAGVTILRDGDSLVTAGKLTTDQREAIRWNKLDLLGMVPELAFRDDDGTYWVFESYGGTKSIVRFDHYTLFLATPQELNTCRNWRLKACRDFPKELWPRPELIPTSLLTGERSTSGTRLAG